MNTEAAATKLNNLQALKAAALAELAATEARTAEMTEAMGNSVEIDHDEYLSLSVETLAATKRAETLDVAIKAASEALRLSHWNDVLTEAREHKAARPDLDAEIMKIAVAARKKLQAIDAKASEWNTANRNMLARIKRSPLRELRENEWNADGGSVPVVDGKVVRDFTFGRVNDMMGKAMAKLDSEEYAERVAAEKLASGPAKYSGGQLMDAAQRGVPVERVAWEDAHQDDVKLLNFQEASRAAARSTIKGTGRILEPARTRPVYKL